MKKLSKVSLAVLLALFLAGQTAPALAYDNTDSVLDKTADWMATVGRSPEERDRVIAERKARRAAKRFNDALKKSGKKAGRAMENFGKNVQKEMDK